MPREGFHWTPCDPAPRRGKIELIPILVIAGFVVVPLVANTVVTVAITVFNAVLLAAGVIGAMIIVVVVVGVIIQSRNDVPRRRRHREASRREFPSYVEPRAIEPGRRPTSQILAAALRRKLRERR